VQATYWFNNTTLEATWTEPEGFRSGGGAAPAAYDPYGGGGDGGGGGGGYEEPAATGGGGEWISYIDDESGAEYWYNETTQETTYEDPNGGVW